MMFFQLLVYTIAISAVVSFIPNRYLRFFMHALCGVYYILQYSAYYTMGEPINYQFYAHLDFSTLIVTFDVEAFRVLTASIVIFLLIYTFDIVVKVLRRKFHILWTNFFLLTLILISMFFSKSYWMSPYVLYLDLNSSNIHTSDTPKEIVSKFDDSFQLTLKNDLVDQYSGNNKNLIVIYLESFENTYLYSDIYKKVNLGRNIFDVKREYNFDINNQYIDTAHYTIGSIFATQCGLPAFFKLPGNNMLKTLGSSQMVCFNNILYRAGYNSLFISGDSDDFGGRGDFLRLNNYKTISKEDFPASYIRGDWGIYDTDVFKYSKEKVTQLSKSKKPFNLNILTLGPHHPNGFYDKRCEQYVPKQNLDIETMVACNAYLVKDFISYIDDLGILDNTMVYVMNDHIGMGGAINIEKLRTNAYRGNFLLSNDSEILEQTITQSSFPAIVLKSLGLKKSAKFFSQNFPDGKQFIKSFSENRDLYFALNESLNRRINLLNGFIVNKTDNGFEIRDEKIIRKVNNTRYAYFEVSRDGDLVSDFSSYDWSENTKSTKDSLFLFLGVENNELKIRLTSYNKFKGIGFIGDNVYISSDSISISKMNLLKILNDAY